MNDIEQIEPFGGYNATKGIISRDNIYDRSDTVQEIISRKPSFAEKWSLLIFLLLLTFILIGTWFIEYPDVVEANAILTSENAPKEIISLKSGKLTHIFAHNGQVVRSHEVIGWIESSASMKEVIELAKNLDKILFFIHHQDSASSTNLDLGYFNQLGELQPAYETFVTAWQQYNDYRTNGYFSRKKLLLSEDISSYKMIKQKTDTQRILINYDNELAKKTFEANEILYKQKVISADEYRQAQSKFLNFQKNLPQADVNVISQQTYIREKQKDLMQLEHDIQLQVSAFEQALNTFRSRVDDWVRQFTIQAPTDGKIVYILPLQINQQLIQGKLLGYVNPPESKYYAEVKLPQKNFGKLDTGMAVQLRFDAYPYQEIGFVPGTLSYISNIAFDSGFLGTIRLSGSLLTNLHKPIQYKTGLRAKAIIISKNMRLIERLYYNISSSIKSIR